MTRSRANSGSSETNIFEDDVDSLPIGFREFYTVGQLAELLQLNQMTIYRIVKTGQLPYHQIGRIMRFRHNDVEGYLRQHRVHAAQPKP